MQYLVLAFSMAILFALFWTLDKICKAAGTE